MTKWKDEIEAREYIKEIVTEYYHDFKEKLNQKKILSQEIVLVMHHEFMMKKKCVR